MSFYILQSFLEAVEFSYTASGGAVFAGAASSTIEFSFTPSGSATFAGAADTSYFPIFEVASTVNLYLTGGANYEFENNYTYFTEGAIVYSGSGDTSYSPTFVYTSSGYAIFAGSASVSLEYSYTSVGSAVFAGSAITSVEVAYTPSGGIILYGVVEPEVEYIYVGSGKIILSSPLAPPPPIIGPIVPSGGFSKEAILAVFAKKATAIGFNMNPDKSKMAQGVMTTADLMDIVSTSISELLSQEELRTATIRTTGIKIGPTGIQKPITNKDAQVKFDITTDPNFFAWLETFHGLLQAVYPEPGYGSPNVFATALKSLIAQKPTSLTGKIVEGTDKVKITI